LENRLHIASQEEEACFGELKGYISALEKYDSTLVNLANIMLIPYVSYPQRALTGLGILFRGN
jgi:hypothetical protein